MHDESEKGLFVSYNSESGDFVRALAATLTMAGARVWLDQWEIRPGDSIPSAIDAGLSGFDTFVLVWSAGAAKSRWVKKEMNAAIARWTAEDSYRLIPVRMDETPVPTVIADLQYIDATDGDHNALAKKLLGINSDIEFRQAIQEFIDHSRLPFRDFHGAGVYVACPKCGLAADKLEGWSNIDHVRGDRYAGVRCPNCGWNEGGEVW